MKRHEQLWMWRCMKQNISPSTVSCSERELREGQDHRGDGVPSRPTGAREREAGAEDRRPTGRGGDDGPLAGGEAADGQQHDTRAVERTAHDKGRPGRNQQARETGNVDVWSRGLFKLKVILIKKR